VEAGIDWRRTLAYAPSAACWGIRLNVVGRDPFGTVPRTEFEPTVERLMSDLRSAATPQGRPYFARVFRPDDDSSRLADVPAAPDVFYEPGEGLGVAMDGPRPIRSSGRKSGEHRAEGIVVRAEGGSLPKTIWEVPHLITDLAGVDPEAWEEVRGTWPRSILTGDDEGSILQHLRGLGYVE
jgi:predicted AlkP superfamily phosphohydrolase/phosphomutase